MKLTKQQKANSKFVSKSIPEKIDDLYELDSYDKFIVIRLTLEQYYEGYASNKCWACPTDFARRQYHFNDPTFRVSKTDPITITLKKKEDGTKYEKEIGQTKYYYWIAKLDNTKRYYAANSQYHKDYDLRYEFTILNDNSIDEKVWEAPKGTVDRSKPRPDLLPPLWIDKIEYFLPHLKDLIHKKKTVGNM